MPPTLAPVTHPNQNSWEGTLLGMRAKVVDVTFDNSYLTTGEVVTAAQLGWDTIHGVVVLEHPQNRGSNGTLSVFAIARPNAARTQVAIQLYETAGTVDTPHKEVTSAQDVSAYTGRFLFLGT